MWGENQMSEQEWKRDWEDSVFLRNFRRKEKSVVVWGELVLSKDVSFFQDIGNLKRQRSLVFIDYLLFFRYCVKCVYIYC